MRLRLLRFYDAITNSFWFVPALMALLAAAAALGSVQIDRLISDDTISNLNWIWSGSASGARSVLATVAGSVMTVVSVVFSITITALAQTSSQYGPRILRIFTADRGNQITLGTFIATFVYCLLVLRTVRSVEGSSFVPDVSVTVGVAMAIASLSVLIYFIHHVSQSIQAEHLIAGAHAEFQHVLRHVFPEQIGQDKEEAGEVREQNHALMEFANRIDWESAHAVMGHRHGYIQRIDDAELMQVACRHDLVIHLEHRPGDFAARHGRLLLAWPAAHVTKQAAKELSACFSVGPNRTPHQDVSYPLQQLVEIAVRALSPGINEPFTAMTCIDWLGGALGSVARCTLPSRYRLDDRGRLRVVAHPLSFEELTAVALDPIRTYGREDPDVMVHLLETIGGIVPHLHREVDRQALIRHTRLIGMDAQEVANSADRARVEQCHRKVLQTLAT